MTAATDAPPSLQVRRGGSTSEDAQVAVRELAEAIRQDDMSLVIFYCGPDYDLAALGEAIKAEFGDVPTAGCTTSGHLAGGRYQHGGLVGASLASPRLAAHPYLIEGLADFTLEDGYKHAEALRGEAVRLGHRPEPSKTFVLHLIDALAGREEVVAMGLDMGLEGVQLVGGSAADESRIEGTFVYHDGAFRQDCAQLMMVHTDHKFHVFKHQHFAASDTKMVVTKADPSERVVKRINGRPAAQEYARILGIELNPGDASPLMRHPAVVRMAGEIFMRTPMAVDEDDGMRFACAIEEGVVLSTGVNHNMTDCLREEMETLREKIGTPAVLVGFDCTGRVHEMETTNQVDSISDIFNANNAVVFATYGEQLGGMHINQTLTAVAIAND